MSMVADMLMGKMRYTTIPVHQSVRQKDQKCRSQNDVYVCKRSLGLRSHLRFTKLLRFH